MLPNSSSEALWEIWANDELQVLCRDGDYYLVLYPFEYTGKFIAAYVPEDSVKLLNEVPDADEFYDIFSEAVVIEETYVYHNPSSDDIINSSGNKKIRSTLHEGDNVKVLFCDGEYLFIKTDSITGYIPASSVSYTKNTLSGDVNGDGIINIDDAVMILKFKVGLIKLTDEQIKIADMNGDGEIDAADAGMILRNF